jgi:hypothetical protein
LPSMSHCGYVLGDHVRRVLADIAVRELDSVDPGVEHWMRAHRTNRVALAVTLAAGDSAGKHSVPCWQQLRTNVLIVGIWGRGWFQVALLVPSLLDGPPLPSSNDGSCGCRTRGLPMW